MTALEFLEGGGEMGARMRAFAWNATPLGAASTWPQPLRTLVAVLLGAGQPMFVAWGPERTMLYNDGYAPLLGAKHPSALGCPFAEVWSDILHAVEPIMDRAYSGVPTYMDDIEFTMVDRHGFPEETHFSFSYTPARDEAGRVAGVFCACNETTAQVLADRRLRLLFDLGDRLRTLDSPSGIMAAAAEALGSHLRTGRVGYGEMDSEEAMLTVERDWTDGSMPSFAGRWQLDDFGPIINDLRVGRTIRLNDARADPRTAGREDLFSAATMRAAIGVPLIKGSRLAAVMYVHQDSPRYWHEEDEALVRNVAERTWDALERLKAEAALRHLNETLEREIEERTAERDRLWTLSEDLLVVANYQGQLLRVSPSWSRLLGYDESTILATRYPDILHPDDVGILLDRVEDMQQTGRPVRVEGRARAADGSFRWIAWTLSPDPGGILLHGVGRDVQEEKLALEELAAANRQLVLQIEERERVEATLRQMQRLEAVGQLTSGVAHDFNNLLTVILGNVRALTRELSDADHLRRLEMMHAAAARGAKLTGQLLAFSRSLRLEPKPVDLNETVTGMRDLIQSTMGGTVDLRLDLHADLWSAMVDPTQIELVVLNLAINARDAMQEGGTLTVSTANATLTGAPVRQEEPPPGEYVVVSVADTGSGMSDEVLAKAFEPFFTTKEVGRGSGLGLSQVLGFAKQSGGGVRVSTREGEGTTVTVYLPRATARVEAPQPQPAPAVADATAGRRPTVLLVDDDAGVREVAAFMLDELGYEVIEAGSGGAALDLLDREPQIDVLLADFAMPGMNGAELAREARAKRPGLPVVFVTGYADFTVLRHVSHERIVQKPLAEEELASKLRAALEAAGESADA
jgi:PAS domain S-box-containing protein